MLNRREFIKRASAIGVGVATGAEIALASGDVQLMLGKSYGIHGIKSVVRQDATIRRLGGLGDGYKITWAGDDRQYFGVNDGAGWLVKPIRFYNSRLWTVAGDPHNVSFDEVAGYPELDKMTRPEEAPSYYGHGTLAVRDRIYQFLSTLDTAVDRPRHWIGAKLIYSPDKGVTWYNQDGSSPVIWEDWEQQSERLVFIQEPQGCFSLCSILQMGRNYSANRDGYIYVYAPNGSVDGQMNELVMFRVPIGRMLDRKAYEYFGGYRGSGGARWVKDIDAREVMHTFPRGWVNYTNLFPGDLVVESWSPSVVYNEPLDLYLMTSSGIGVAPDGTEFGKPSYLGFWVSSTPWGPWEQIYEETAWKPGNDTDARAYAPQIAPKWIAEDGRSFWLLWADLQGMGSFTRDRSVLAESLQRADNLEERTAVIAEFHRRKLPYYAFNTQRVDLIL